MAEKNLKNIAEPVYQERLTSNHTLALFMILTAVFFLLFLWQISASGLDGWATTALLISLFFLFYVFNFRVLTTTITPAELTLNFGLFTWTVPRENIAGCQLDQIGGFMRNGGAGIHFMLIKGRYRASLNFLEYPRILIAFKHKVGPVRDLSFSTRKPDEIIRLLQPATSVKDASP